MPRCAPRGSARIRPRRPALRAPSARFRPVQLPDTGQVIIPRQEAEVPLLSELLLANLLHEGGRPVTIATRRWTAVLRGTGEFSAWIQVTRH